MKHRQIEQTRKDGRRNCAGPAGPREAGLAGGDGRDSEGQSQQGPHHTVRRGCHATVPFKDQARCPLSSEPHTLQPDETGHTGWPRSTVCGFGSRAGSTFIHHRGVDGEEVSPPQGSQISTRHAHGSFFRLFERVLRVLVPKQGRDPCPLTVGEGGVGSGLTATAEGKNCPRPQAPAVWGQGPPGSLRTVNRGQREMRYRDQERADPWARCQEETVPSEQTASGRWEAVLKAPSPQGRRLGSGLGHAFPACHQVMPRTGVQGSGRCSGSGRAPLRPTLTAQAALTAPGQHRLLGGRRGPLGSTLFLGHSRRQPCSHLRGWQPQPCWAGQRSAASTDKEAVQGQVQARHRDYNSVRGPTGTARGHCMGAATTGAHQAAGGRTGL